VGCSVNDEQGECIRCGLPSRCHWRPSNGSKLRVTLCAACLLDTIEVSSKAFALWLAVSGEESLEVGRGDLIRRH